MPGGKAVLRKVDKEGAKEVGADGLAKALTSGDKVNSVSTAVTRAIGDWDGSRALVPHPEVLRFTVAKDQCLRCVLASDSLWDFLTTEACKVMRRGRRRLRRQAGGDDIVNGSEAEYNELKDDLTAIVVEHEPGEAAADCGERGQECVLRGFQVGLIESTAQNNAFRSFPQDCLRNLGYLAKVVPQ